MTLQKINIESALSFLQAQCDGARQRDNVGFNGLDATFARSCSRFYNRAGFLTDKQRGVLGKMLVKYSGQLSALGVELDVSLPGPTAPLRPVVCRTLDLDGPGANIVISFPYDAGVVEQIKLIHGRNFDSDTKTWTVPFDVANVNYINEFLTDFERSDRLVEEIEVLFAVHAKSEVASRATDCDFDVNTKEPLYPFQRAGVQFALDHGDKVLIADEMGLGKTWQAIGYLSENRQRPAVVICPASLKLNWKKEVERLIDGETVAVLNNQKKDEALPEASIYILNYDLCATRKPSKKAKKLPPTSWLVKLSEIGVKTVILDESHYIKNAKAKRSKAVLEFAAECANILCLTGTPILNRPIELFTTLNLLRPDVFPSYYSFAFRYCGAYKSKYGLVTGGVSNLEELKVKLATVMVRRQKQFVLKELPAKTRSMIPLPLDNEKEYKLVETDLIAWLKEQGKDVDGARRGAALQKIEYCKQVAARGKLAAAIDWCKDFVNNDEKLIIFATHKATIQAVADAFKDKCVVVDGSVSLDDRDAAVTAFQTNPDVKVFVGNIKAAGVGLTLTASSNVVFFELGWTPGEHDQAEDRAHRIGQKDAVNAWYLLAPGTIDELIARLIDSKREVITRLLDKEGTVNANIFNELIAELFSR